MRWRTRARYARYSASVPWPPPDVEAIRVPVSWWRPSPAPGPTRAVTVGGREGVDADSLAPEGVGLVVVVDGAEPLGAGASRSTVTAGGLARTALTVGAGCCGGSATLGADSVATAGGGGAGAIGVAGDSSGGCGGGGSGERGIDSGITVAIGGAGEIDSAGAGRVSERARVGAEFLGLAGGPSCGLATSVGRDWTWAASGRSVRSTTNTSSG